MEELIPIFLFMSIAAVMILRPISKKLGTLLEAMARERLPQANADTGELTRIRVLVEHVAKRVDLMEERLDFTERLLSNSKRPSLAATARMDSYGRAREPDYLEG